MIEFSEDIGQCLSILKKGGTILYPTDTIWGIGCDATNARAVSRVYRIKRRTESKQMILLLDDKEKLNRYVSKVPAIAIELMESLKTPVTIVYPGAKNLARNLISKDRTIAIRISTDDFSKALIREFVKPIVSTSANISGEPPALTFSQVNPEILKEVDYAVAVLRDRLEQTRPSTIIRIVGDNAYEILRS